LGIVPTASQVQKSLRRLMEPRHAALCFLRIRRYEVEDAFSIDDEPFVDGGARSQDRGSPERSFQRRG
jgi:hypothetical protein